MYYGSTILNRTITSECFLVSDAWAAQEEAWLKFEPPIKGTAKTEKYRDQIVVQSISYGLNQTSKVPGRPLTIFKELTVVKDFNITSPTLAQFCADE